MHPAMSPANLFKEVERLQPALLRDLQTLLAIPSRRSEPTDGAPYGVSCRQALDTALRFAQREGLATRIIDGHMGYASFGPKTERGYLAAIAHLDVVEEGTGWHFPPFGGEIAHGRLYGRGALDNKGPGMAAFYGLLALKNLGFAPQCEIRMLFGTNEETGMADIRHYLRVEDAPAMAFVPDNKFPAIYGERGRARYHVDGSLEDLANFLNRVFLSGKAPTHALGIDVEDASFGAMILRGTRLELFQGNLRLHFQLSTPTCDPEAVDAQIKQAAAPLTVCRDFWEPWVLQDPQAPLVSTLQAVYDEAADLLALPPARPTTTTGMTYAHFCPNAIPFGPSFPGQNGIAHLPDEWFALEDLLRCTKVYALAFLRLHEAMCRS